MWPWFSARFFPRSRFCLLFILNGTSFGLSHMLDNRKSGLFLGVMVVFDTNPLVKCVSWHYFDLQQLEIASGKGKGPGDDKFLHLYLLVVKNTAYNTLFFRTAKVHKHTSTWWTMVKHPCRSDWSERYLLDEWVHMENRYRWKSAVRHYFRLPPPFRRKSTWYTRKNFRPCSPPSSMQKSKHIEKVIVSNRRGNLSPKLVASVP